VDPLTLDSTAKKKQVVALIDGLPQMLVTGECPFIVPEGHKASILFNPSAAEAWLEALEDQDHITDLYIVTPVKRDFDALKAKASEVLGDMLVPEDEKRPMSEGFEANLAYFRLDFLDPDRVALKQSFREILPLLWLKAGAKGPRPECPERQLPRMLIPEGNTFAVLLNEATLPAFVACLRDRNDLTHLFLVTDDQDAFKDMMAELNDHLGEANPNLAFTQLYMDYLENFLINKGQVEGGMA
jgi:adenine-specific DNA-methyltransferase